MAPAVVQCARIRRADVTFPLPHHLAKQTLLLAALGVQFGLFEAARLRRAGFPLSAGDIGAHVAAHLVVAVAVGLAFVLSMMALVRVLEWRMESGSLAAAARRWQTAVPLFCTIFVLLGFVINVRYLPALLSPVSFAANAVLLALVVACALAWHRRPWPKRGDRFLLAGVLMVDLLAALWAWGGPAAALPVVRRPVEDSPDLVLVMIDTLRPDHLGAYGYGRETSPRMDELAAAGTVFERAYSPSNWTRPAVASLFSSAMPSRHGAIEIDRAVSPDLPLLAESLSRSGYAVGFFTRGGNVEPADGYDRGVDYFYHRRSRSTLDRAVLISHLASGIWPGLRRWLDGPVGETDSDGASTLTDRALQWIRHADKGRPVFLYIHYMGPHRPYAAPPPFDLAFSESPPVPRLMSPPDPWAGAEALTPSDREQMIAQYDAEVLWHDAEVGRLISGLRQAGRPGGTVLAITADHGEAFGEHGMWGHNAGLFEEQVRVPLIMWSDLGWDHPRRLALPVSLLDLAPTLLEIAGAEIPPSFDGGSLLGWLRGLEVPAERSVFMENPRHDEIGVRTAAWSYFEGSDGAGHGRWLYRADDLAQATNLVAQLPQVAEELRELAVERQRLDRERAGKPASSELSEDRRERLRALGYLD